MKHKKITSERNKKWKNEWNIKELTNKWDKENNRMNENMKHKKLTSEWNKK